ncbi:MAG: tRNA (adenosine(37)-N6)-dimethylallyltransferase MiaA [Pseudomonadota bacterium]
MPILVAGPTASGKSALALEIAGAQGRTIVNADALQVYDCWRVLSARPSPEEEAQVPHALYGHVPWDVSYSVGDWLRAVSPLLAERPAPVIVGGTGLYFRALTEGLAEIPPTPSDIRAAADAAMAKTGHETLLSELDPETATRIDTANPARVQRAWEVLKTTGRGLAHWQDATPAPLLPAGAYTPLLLDADKDWLSARIAQRFALMLDGGALEEVRAMLLHWDPARPSSKAIGAPELVAYLRGETTLEAAREAAIISTRQYAKRQRTWFRARMGGWTRIALPS